MASSREERTRARVPGGLVEPMSHTENGVASLLMGNACSGSGGGEERDFLASVRVHRISSAAKTENGGSLSGTTHRQACKIANELCKILRQARSLFGALLGLGFLLCCYYDDDAWWEKGGGFPPSCVLF